VPVTYDNPRAHIVWGPDQRSTTEADATQICRMQDLVDEDGTPPAPHPIAQSQSHRTGAARGGGRGHPGPETFQVASQVHASSGSTSKEIDHHRAWMASMYALQQPPSRPQSRPPRYTQPLRTTFTTSCARVARPQRAL
jgi:hypothetical protein